MPRLRTIPPLLIVALFLAPLAAAPAAAQDADAEAELSEHPEWLAAGKRTEIPWRVKIHSPRLGFDQRLHVTIEVTIDGRTLNRRGDRHDLVLLARMAGADGEWLPSRGLRRANIVQRLPRRSRVVVRLGAVVRPGRYTVGVVMLDRLTGARNVFLAPLEVSPLRNDPLADAWRGLPRVVFLGPAEAASPALLHRQEARQLPVASKRPLAVEILTVLSPSEQFAGSVRAQRATLARLLPALDVLAGLSLANGSLRVTAVDLVRRRVAYQQDLSARPLDWPAITAALEEINPVVVSAEMLEEQRERAAWFREMVEARLAEPARSAAASPESVAPHRVLIILSSAQVFPRRSDLRPLTPPADCDCSVYHLEFRISRENLWDQIGRILRPLRPRRRVIEQPMHLRRAVAEILDHLRRM